MNSESFGRDRQLDAENERLHRKLTESLLHARDARDARLAALNLLEDAQLARELAEKVGSALRVSERELRQRETELLLVQQAGGIAGIVIDLSGEAFVGVRSEEYRRLHGLAPEVTREEHEDWLRRLHPDDREWADRALREAVGGLARTYESEYRIIRPIDGEERWILAKANIERDVNGKPVRLIGAHIDITHRKRLEEAMRENEERLRALFDSMAEAFVVMEALLDGRGRIVEYRYLDCNPAFLREIGEADVLGRTLRDVFPDIEPIWVESFEKVLDTGQPVKFQSYLSTLARWLDVSVTRLGGAGSLRVAVIFTDITSRKHSEEALRESEEKYRTLFESIDQGFCIIEVLFDGEGRSCDYRFLEANPAFETQTGLKGAIGRTMRELAPHHEDYWFEIYGRVATTGEPVRFEGAVEALGRYYDVNAFQVGTAGENRVAVLFHDITDRKRHESNLAFLSDITADIARLTTAEEAIGILGAKIGAHFDASLVALSIIDQECATMITEHAWSRAGVSDTVGRHRITDYHTDEFVRAMRAGETYVVHDVTTDSRVHGANLAALQVGAFLTVPLVRRNEWRSNLSLATPHSRTWREDEVELLRELANRLWVRLERARAEEALRLSEEKYRTLFDSMDEGYCIIQMLYDEEARPCDWRYLQVNRAFERNNGLSDAEGRTIRELAPAIESKWLEIYDHVAQTGEPRRFEEDSVALGRVFNLFAFRIGEPGERKVAVIFTDITERERAADALRASQETLQLVLESAREYAIVTMDLQRHVTTWNSGAQRLLGYSEAEILGRSADVIFIEEDRAAGAPQEEASDALSDGQAKDERWHRRKDGTRFWGSGLMMTMHDAQGDVIGLLKILRDHTDARAAQQALEESREQLVEALQQNEQARAEVEAASQAKDHFLAILSHELRTPLSPVLMTLKTLERRPDVSDAVRGQLDIIRRNVRVEARLIDDLLDVTRIGQGKFDLIRKRLDLHHVVCDAMQTVEPDVEAKGQTLASSLEATRFELDGDSTRLQQAVWNLLRNASKFTPEGGRIHLATRDDSDSVFVEVSDTGIGIDPASCELIFDAFRQGASVERKLGGLGLGLAISKAIIEAHGGRIWAHSAGENQGAVFTFVLPLTT